MKLKLFGYKLSLTKIPKSELWVYRMPESKYRIEQTYFNEEFKTYVWYKSQILKIYSLKLPPAQTDVDRDFDKANEFVEKLENLEIHKS